MNAGKTLLSRCSLDGEFRRSGPVLPFELRTLTRKFSLTAMRHPRRGRPSRRSLDLHPLGTRNEIEPHREQLQSERQSSLDGSVRVRAILGLRWSINRALVKVRAVEWPVGGWRWSA